MKTDLFTLNFYEEICCEICNDVIHNHFDCPACGDQYAGTDIYGCEIDHTIDKVMCQECNASFEWVKGKLWKRLE